MDIKKISDHRKKLSILKQKRNRLEDVATGRSSMAAASFITRRVRPDAPLVYYLSASIAGQSRHRYVRKCEVEYWRKRAYAWKEYIAAMASWVKINIQIEKELREVGRLRCEELPVGRKKSHKKV
ncbi:MAG: hypothetical protein ABFR82_17690 [Nitrospirota bacterium]